MADDFFDVGRLLLHVAREFSDRVCHELVARDHPDLRATHALLIAHLDTVGTRVTLLAERAGVSKQAMGQLVKEMESLGYVTRERDPQDARAVLVVPTAHGEKLLRDVAEVARVIEAYQVSKIGATELKRLRETLLQWLS